MNNSTKTPEHPYLDPELPLEDRVNDLLGRMTLEEKAAQMCHGAPAIERLGIPEYNWWNECLHGVGRYGIATVFPQAIGLAATWNSELMQEIASTIADEARAKHHEAVRQGNRDQYAGLTFWSPNINIFRDPRWGRGQETYGEDPYLTGRMGVAFVKGLQGDHDKYLKTVATPKHYAVHSGPEKDRHSLDAKSNIRDMKETYLPAFKACVQEACAFSVMSAYNRTNGEACTASRTLLNDILRDEWGFKGYVVSDCGAVYDIFANHKVVETREEAAALAVKNGCDLNCGDMYTSLVEAAKKDLITEDEIDIALRRLLTARFKLGMFDPPETVPYAQIPYEVNDCNKHRELAREAARQSVVLLKNENNILPLSKDLKTIAVVGPLADDTRMLIGNYFGTPSNPVSFLQGIKDAVADDTEIIHAAGCDLKTMVTEGFDEARDIAEKADAVILCVGLSPILEGEEGEVADSDGGGDRSNLELPGVQGDLIKTMQVTGKPVVVLLTCGSPLNISWAKENVPAIVCAWYPGGEGGHGVADVLFGDYNPAGRLPVTFYRSLDQLPPFDDYSMAGRTYRFMDDEPVYPFGFGLSYSTFRYEKLGIRPAQVKAGESVLVSVEVTNTSDIAGEEIVQVYVQDLDASVPVPSIHLEGFRRLRIAPGEKQYLEFTLGPEQFSVVADDGTRFVEPGEFQVLVGGIQPGSEELADGATGIVTGRFEAIERIDLV